MTPIQKKGALYGVSLGITTGLLYVIMYYLVVYVANTFAVILAFGFVFKFILPIICCCFFTFYLRKNIGGYWQFRPSVTGIFVMVVIAYAINFLVTEGLFGKVVASDKDKIISVKTVNAYTDYIKKSDKINQAEKDKRITELKIDNTTAIKLSFANVVAYIAQLILVLFIISLALAAIFKKEPPVYYRPETDPTV